MDALSIINALATIGFENPLVQATVIGLLRGLAGWVQHSLEDNKITLPEIKQLISTILRVLPQSIGLTAFGIPAVGALFSDVFVTKLAKVAERKK